MRLRRLASWLVVLASCKSATKPPEPASNTKRAESQPVADVTPPSESQPASALPVDASVTPVPGAVDVAASAGAKPVIHGDKWQDTEEGGRNFAAFKETWVYVDGVAKGAMLFAELPVELPIAWKDDFESLDFTPSDPPPHEKKIQVLRWRLADYLRMIGVDVAKIAMVYLHGTGYVAIPGDRFRRFADGITFDLTGNDLSKTRFFWPANMPTNTSYDRYAVVSVFIDKPPLTLDRHNNPFIDGEEVMGVPYHGSPERGGFRVYVDNKLAMVVKRNELGAVGRVTNERWDLGKLLEARGVKAKPVAGDLVYSKDLNQQRRERLDQDYVEDVQIGVNAQASGTMLVGKGDRPATALHLYTKGHVPRVLPLPPFRRDPPRPTKKKS